MKTTTVTRLKNSLSAQLKEVVAGETLLITDRRKPIAMLQPLGPGEGAGKLASLSARGIVSPPQKPFSLATFLKQPKAGGGPDLTAAILEEREDR
jgi:antitoxin (DNA-binding transcriptional repressor) of toxin-antitoxin stability system